MKPTRCKRRSTSELRLCGLAVTWLACSWVPGAISAQAQERSPWHIQAEAITDFPLDIGARVVVEGPLRLRLSTSLGALPSPYLAAINDTVVAAGGYTQQTATLIGGSLSSSLIWRTHLGWRPFPDAGFVFDVGYSLVTFGGGLDTAAVVTAATGETLVPTLAAPAYHVTSTLQMIDADVGWEWRLFRDQIIVEAGLGFARTVAASTTVTPQGSASPRTDPYAADAAAYLDSLYTRYAFTPVATVAAGYRFF